MLDTLNSIDTSLLLFFNGAHCEFFDFFFWKVTKTWAWTLFFIGLILPMVKGNWRQALLIIIGIALVVTFADQISSGLIKHAVERFRPTHNPAIQGLVHIVNDYRGGNYGFVSSHAANTFGVAFFLSLIFRNRLFSVTMFSYAVIVSYSRIYLGVHYPGDILGGIAVGMIVAFVVFRIYCWLKMRCHYDDKYGAFRVTTRQIHIAAGALALNILLIIINAAILCFEA